MPSLRGNQHERVTCRFIQDALNGAAKGLIQHILATKNCDADISGRIIHLINPQSIPGSLNEPEAYNSVTIAKGAISVVFTQCRVILSEEADGKKMGQLLSAHHSSFLRWFRFFVDHPPPAHTDADAWFPCVTIAHFLHMMVVVDDDLENVIMSSTSAVRTIVKLWNKRYDGGRYTSGGGRGGSCPMVGLLLCVINHDLGMDTLLALSHTNPRGISRIALTLRKRVREQDDDRLPGSYSIRRLTELVNLGRALSRPSTLFPRHCLRHLHSPNFLSDLCHTLHAILRRHADTFPLDEVINALKLVGDFTLSGDVSDSDPSKMVKAALDSGVYSIIIKAIDFTPRSPHFHSFLLSFLLETATYAIYPKISRSLLDAIDDAVESDDKDDEGFRMCWNMISVWGSQREASRKDGGLTQSIKCDYIHHPGTGPLSGEEEARPKKCSKCNTIVYCSSRCQRLDWDSGHREECGITVVPETLAKHKITLRLLAAQASFIEDLFSNKFELLATLPKTGFPRCLTRIDARLLPIEACLVLKDSFQKATSADRVRVVSAYLAHSARDLNVHIVDAWLPWGGYTVNILVRLRRVANDDFRALSWMLIDICPSDTVNPLLPLASISLL